MKSLVEYIKSISEGRYEPKLKCSQSHQEIKDYIEYGMDYNEMKFLFDHLNKYSKYTIYPCSWKARDIEVHTDMPFVVKRNGKESIIVNKDDEREFYNLESFINDTDFDGLIIMKK